MSEVRSSWLGSSWLGAAAVLAVASWSCGAAASTNATPEPARASPPVLDEQVPPPPRTGAFTWLPGRWHWVGIGGAEWQWESGRYVAWPPPARAETAIDRAPANPDGWQRAGEGWR